MLYLAFLVVIFAIVMMFIKFEKLDDHDAVGPYFIITLIVGLSIAASGVIIDDNKKPSEVNDFNVCDSTEVYDIKGFSYTDVSSKSNNIFKEEKNNMSNFSDYDNDTTFNFVYCDTNKKDSVKVDSTTTIVFETPKVSKDKYTKNTVNVYSDKNKKEIVDTKTFIVSDESSNNTDSNANEYTKLTVKTKEVFQWFTFINKTYKQYIFN